MGHDDQMLGDGKDDVLVGDSDKGDSGGVLVGDTDVEQMDDAKKWKMLWVMVPGMMIVIWRLVIYMKMRIVKMTWCMVQLPPH